MASVTESFKDLEKPLIQMKCNDTCDLHNIETNQCQIVHTFVCLLVTLPADTNTHK